MRPFTYTYDGKTVTIDIDKLVYVDWPVDGGPDDRARLGFGSYALSCAARTAQRIVGLARQGTLGRC